MNRKRVHIYLNEETKAMIDQHSKDTGVSRSSLISLAIQEFFENKKESVNYINQQLETARLEDKQNDI